LRPILGCLLVAFLFLSEESSAQEFFLLEASGNIYKSNASTCTNQLLTTTSCGGTGDIAYFKDTLYYVSGYTLFRTLASNPAAGCAEVGKFNTVNFNSLTVDSTGTVYAAGSDGISFYKPSTGETRFLGNWPPNIHASGDLTFYKGKLYVACYTYDNSTQTSFSCLVEVNLQNPSLSTIFMKLKSGSVYGCITLPKDCDTNGFYITGQELNVSFLVEIDMVNKIELPRKCTYNFYVWGAASYTESGTTNRPDIDSIVMKPACSSEGNNGSVQIFASKTGSLLTYTLNGTNSNTTGNFIGLSPATYNIRVESEKSCLVDTTVTVTLVTSPTIAVTATQPTCKNGDGAITVKPTNTSTGLVYALNGGAYQNPNIFAGLSGGTHTIIAANSSGCTVSKSLTLTLPIIDTSGKTISIVDATCNRSNGSIVARAPNAVGPLLFSINNINPALTGSFTGMPGNTYGLTITDANGCRFDTSLTLKTTPVPIIDSIVSPLWCATTTAVGSMTIYTKKTGDVFSYNLNNTGTNTTGSFSPLLGANYSVRVSNQYSCVVDTTFEIRKVPLPTFTLTQASPDCIADNGWIAMKPLDASKDVWYNMNGQNYVQLDTFKNLAANAYIITAKNAAGCTDVKSVQLTTPTINRSGITVNATNPLCSKENGSIMTTTQNVALPLSFNVNGVTTASGSFTNLAAALYKLVVTDGKGCSFDTSLLLTTNPAPVIDSITHTVSCSATPAAGAIQVYAKQTGTANYFLNNTTSNQTGVFVNLHAGVYHLRTSNVFGCTVDTTVNLPLSNSPTFTVDLFQPSCKGDDGKVLLHAGVVGQEVKFSFGGSSFDSKDVFANIRPGSYPIIAVNKDGCQVNKSITLNPASINKNGISISTQNTTCNFLNGSIKVAAASVAAPFSISINGATAPDGSLQHLAAAPYKISVVDGNHCSFDTTVNLLASPVIKPQTQITKVQPTCPNAFDGTISFTVSGPNSPYQLSINNGLFTGAKNYAHLKEGSYSFIIKNAESCIVDSLTVPLVVPANSVCSSIYFPNAFTPNSDGLNDWFRPKVYGVLESYSFFIYNRAGQKIAEFKDPTKAWDGTFQGVRLDSQTFAWFCTYKFFGQNQVLQSVKGTVVLIR
jgi:gliding motility-associated-like protein